MSSVRHILQVKGHDIWATPPNTTVYDALRQMAEKDVGALLVMKGDALQGIISERDYARKIILRGKTSRETLVGEVMTNQVYTVHPAQTAQECMEIMLTRHVRHLPVVLDGKVIGVVSIGDVMHDIIYQQKESIKSLETRLRNRLEGRSHLA